MYSYLIIIKKKNLCGVKKKTFSSFVEYLYLQSQITFQRNVGSPWNFYTIFF